jgi:hypothetical protein
MIIMIAAFFVKWLRAEATAALLFGFDLESKSK